MSNASCFESDQGAGFRFGEQGFRFGAQGAGWVWGDVLFRRRVCASLMLDAMCGPDLGGYVCALVLGWGHVPFYSINVRGGGGVGWGRSLG